SWQPDITKTDTSEITAHILNSAYIDDTIWITDSLSKLTVIFDIAQSFLTSIR
ncbi:16023_t:CDS:1, partial [Funneliformis geosporum]